MPKSNVTWALLSAALAVAALAPAIAPAHAASTETRVKSTANPSTSGQTVTFTATVATFGAGAPTGTVTFNNGAAELGIVNVDSIGAGYHPIAPGDAHSCVLTSVGGVKCFGWTLQGRLGDGNTPQPAEPQPVPVDVSGLTSGATAVGVGYQHSCAVTGTGGVKCWGLNHKGQLGDTTTTERATPVDVSGLTDAIAVSGGSEHTCALTSAGGVKCWGYNGSGQLGDGTLTDSLTPVGVSGLISGVTAISAKLGHTCALTSAGGVKCWGQNGVGQLGDGTGNLRPEPVDVSGLTSGVTAISAGGFHVCALTSAGTIKCWGSNLDGQFGDGTATSSATPVDASGLSNIIGIAAGELHTCALTSVGGVKCWGQNAAGQLGNGTVFGGGGGQPTPTDVTGLASGVSMISAGHYTTCAVTTAGVPKCWGANQVGQLGNGTTIESHVPGDVMNTTVAVFGKATFSTAALAIGAHTITGVYNGGLNHDPSTSPALTQTVNKAATTTTVESSLSTSTFGQSVTFTATVAGPGATGNVTFQIDGLTQNPLGTVSGGTATFSIAGLSAGAHSVVAVYNGDSGYSGSTSSTITQTVDKASTSTTVSATPNPSGLGVNVTFTATVTSVAGLPLGNVTVLLGATPLASSALVGGQVQYATTQIPVGVHTFTVAYGGSANFNASTSSAITQTVSKGGSTLSASATPNPGKPGQPVSLKATVTATAPATGTPTGSVTFKKGSTTLGSGALSAGKVTVATSALTIGSHTIAANYAGSANLTASAANLSVIIDPKVGAEFRVNTATANAQQFPVVSYLNNGNFVAAWASNLQDGSGYGVYAQRHNASGTRLGTEFKVNTVTANNQTTPAIAPLSNGGFVIVWASTNQDGSGLGIYGQRYSAGGTKSGAEFKVNTTTAKDQSLPAVAGLKAGGFVAAWASKDQDTSALGVYAQRYDSAGKAAGVEFKVNTAVANNQSTPAIAALTGGGFAIVWDSLNQDGAGLRIYGQRYSATGVKVSVEFKVNTATAKDQSLPSATGLKNGGFVVAWQSKDQDGSGLGVYAQRFAANGGRSGLETRVNTVVAGDQSQPSVTSLPDGGGFIVLWTSANQDGSGQGVFAQAYKAGGQPIDVEFRVNATTANNQNQPSVAASTGGSFVAVWTSKNQDGALEGVYGQRFSVPATAMASEPASRDGPVAMAR